MLKAITGIAILLAITGTVAGFARPGTEQQVPGHAIAEGVVQRCPDARAGVAFYRMRYTAHRKIRDVHTPYPAGRKPRNCADAHYLAEEWNGRAWKERIVTQQWLVDQRTLYDQPTWIRAMREVQKAYPDTEWWLRSCSSTEGAGRNLSINYFQMNHEGSGAGGWMQFMESTFWRMYWASVDDLRERGFAFPKETASWSSRLGQAMAAAWGFTHGRRGEWHGSGCN